MLFNGMNVGLGIDLLLRVHLRILIGPKFSPISLSIILKGFNRLIGNTIHSAVTFTSSDYLGWKFRKRLSTNTEPLQSNQQIQYESSTG